MSICNKNKTVVGTKRSHRTYSANVKLTARLSALAVRKMVISTDKHKKSQFLRSFQYISPVANLHFILETLYNTLILKQGIWSLNDLIFFRSNICQDCTIAKCTNVKVNRLSKTRYLEVFATLWLQSSVVLKSEV